MLDLIVTIVTVLVLLPQAGNISRNNSSTVTIIYFSILVAHGVAAYYILQWKRWAVQMLAGLMVCLNVFYLISGTLQLTNLLSLIFGLGMLAVFVHPNWDDYE